MAKFEDLEPKESICDPCSANKYNYSRLGNTASLLGLDSIKKPSSIMDDRTNEEEEEIEIIHRGGFEIEGTTWDGKKVIIMTNDESGRVERRVMDKDGHLGALEA